LKLKMRRGVRSFRQFRYAFQRQECNYSFSLGKCQKVLIDTGYRVTDNADIDKFSCPKFIASRTLTTDAARVSNGGDILFWVHLALILGSLVFLQMDFSLVLVLGFCWICRC
jgi:hypothetical protein